MTAPPTAPAAALQPQEFLDLVQRQRDEYQRLQELARQQGQAVDRGETDPLLALLAQRQAVVVRLGALNLALEPYRQGLAQVRAVLSPAQRRQANQLLDEIEALRRDILSQDERDCRTLGQNRAAIGAELAKVNHVGRAMNAYRGAGASQPPPVASRFTDQKG